MTVKTLIILVFVFIVVPIVGLIYIEIDWFHSTQKYKCVEVTGKERIMKNETSYYLIFTKSGEFTVKDRLFRGNFNSSTWYGLLENGKSYTFKTEGYRFPILSWYENIITKPNSSNCIEAGKQ